MTHSFNRSPNLSFCMSCWWNIICKSVTISFQWWGSSLLDTGGGHLGRQSRDKTSFNIPDIDSHHLKTQRPIIILACLLIISHVPIQDWIDLIAEIMLHLYSSCQTLSCNERHKKDVSLVNQWHIICHYFSCKDIFLSQLSHLNTKRLSP